ncbi:hypothetical protein B0H19DRAFT_115099 [Mycena capillaripes]|nr:hypothetical protein B0H19DRAFT_115099 [Mycena capillaripes]
MDASAFTRRWWQATEVLYETAFDLVLYVAFLGLFILAIRHLCLNKISGGRSLVVITSTMFILATAQMILYLHSVANCSHRQSTGVRARRPPNHQQFIDRRSSGSSSPVQFTSAKSPN